MGKDRFIRNAIRSSTALVIMIMLLSALIANALLISLSNSEPVYAVTETFNTAGTYTWTAPSGVTSVTVEIWGGGGRGGTVTGSIGGGGGGGAYSKKENIAITPGNSYTYVVGYGSGNTSPGGDSWFLNQTTVLAKGGNSVPNDTDTGAMGGQASSGVGDPGTMYSGGNGATGLWGKTKKGGGGGSSAGTAAAGNDGSVPTGGIAPDGGGNGGDGASSYGQAGNNGSEPGGGGGGGRGAAGGNGADGQVRITYQYNTTITVSPATGTYGGTTSLTAILTITGGAAVNGKTINFTLNGNPVGSATTNTTGVANLPDASMAGIEPGTYPNGVGASFTGDADYITSSGTASLTVNPTPASIDITAPDDISDWVLNPVLGENTYSGTLSVDVTPYSTSWSVTAKDTDAATGGYMTEWSGSAYGTAKLENPMRVQGPAAEVTMPNSAGIDIATGEGDYPVINITFKQTITWDDDPGTYQIVVTFIGTVN